MNLSDSSIIPGPVDQGDTASGARIKISSDTPWVHYRDEIICFCADDCKHLYDEDPLSSCMATRLLSAK